MTRQTQFERAAGLLAVVSALVAIASLVAIVVAVGGDPEALDDPLAFLQVDARGAAYGRAGMILDMFGYYLLIVPLILVLRQRLKASGAGWADLGAFCLLGYSLLGAAGAAILAVAVPPLAAAYRDASADQQLVLQTIHTTLMNVITIGVWNLLEELLAGAGWLIFGVLLLRQHRALAVVSLALGCASSLDGVAVIMGSDALAAIGRNLYLILAPLWALWAGIVVLRSHRHADRADRAEPERQPLATT